ncbi:LytTR family DNA-binding domain-containing protein [Aquincola sp. MAHUQ-54]|uniref:LytTR family DNA-binding domain-containing protein n=1 Tax=Aquincola agrisoli TaxID=3119538 RepID=A0AAW9Q9R4_9BURK
MTTLTVLIVDDEPLARLRLKALVQACGEPRCEVMAEAGNAAQALAWLIEHPCDLVLLDVQMPGQSGMRFAAELKRLPRLPAVVFVTAHADHALEAFELDAADYLTKPVRRERLQAALQRVALRLGRYETLPAEVPALVVSERGRVLRVPLADVLYLKAELKYVTLRTAERSYLLDDSLTELEPRLGDRFLRIHRNALVARSAVRALVRGSQPGEADEAGEGWAVQVAPVDEWLSVSRRQLAAVREAIEAGKW